MPYDGSVWDETQPTQSTLANTIDSVMRDMKIGVQVRLANEHSFPAVQTSSLEGGQHIFISLQQQTATPTFPLVGTTTQDGILFSSSALGLCYATYNTGAYNVVQLVGTGQKINISGAIYSATGTIGDILIGQTGTSHALKVLPAPTITSGSSMVVLQSNGTTGDPVWGTVVGLGSWTSESIGSIYQAATDGFVVAWAAGAASNVYIQGYTDSIASPTTLRIQNGPGNTNVGSFVSIMFPVRKGDYWKVVMTGATSSTSVYWIPLGT